MVNYQEVAVISALLSFFLFVESSDDGPSFVLQPQDSIAYRNGSLFSVTLHCVPAHNSSVRWYKGDVILGLGHAGLPQHTEHANGSIVVSASDDTDGIQSIEGSYYCTITNDKGSARSKDVQVRGDVNIPVC